VAQFVSKFSHNPNERIASMALKLPFSGSTLGNVQEEPDKMKNGERIFKQSSYPKDFKTTLLNDNSFDDLKLTNTGSKTPKFNFKATNESSFVKN
jgi:hypothetical protein